MFVCVDSIFIMIYRGFTYMILLCSFFTYNIKVPVFFFFLFLIYVGCPGQLTRTTTIPHGPLDALQAQEQVRHRGGDRRAHRGSNPGRGRNKSHDWPQQLDPQVQPIHGPRFYDHLVCLFLVAATKTWPILTKGLFTSLV